MIWVGVWFLITFDYFAAFVGMITMLVNLFTCAAEDAEHDDTKCDGLTTAFLAVPSALFGEPPHPLQHL